MPVLRDRPPDHLKHKDRAVAYYQGISLFLQLLTLAAVTVGILRAQRDKKQLAGLVRTSADEVFDHFQQLLALRDLLRPGFSLTGTRGWAASPDFLLQVVKHALREKPMTIVECSSGTSTLVLARACQLNGQGHVVSLEHDPHYAQSTRDSLRLNGLAPYATVIDAPLLPVRIGEERWHWYAHDLLPSAIDLIVVDGPPGTTQALARYPALPLLKDKLAHQATVFLDDANRPDEVEIIRRWQSEFGLVRAPGVPTEKGIAILQKH